MPPVCVCVCVCRVAILCTFWRKACPQCNLLLRKQDENYAKILFAIPKILCWDLMYNSWDPMLRSYAQFLRSYYSYTLSFSFLRLLRSSEVSLFPSLFLSSSLPIFTLHSPAIVTVCLPFLSTSLSDLYYWLVLKECPIFGVADFGLFGSINNLMLNDINHLPNNNWDFWRHKGWQGREDCLSGSRCSR